MLTKCFKLNLSVFNLLYEKSINEKKRNINLMKRYLFTLIKFN